MFYLVKLFPKKIIKFKTYNWKDEITYYSIEGTLQKKYKPYF